MKYDSLMFFSIRFFALRGIARSAENTLSYHSRTVRKLLDIPFHSMFL